MNLRLLKPLHVHLPISQLFSVWLDSVWLEFINTIFQ